MVENELIPYDLRSFENKLNWDYNIPRTLSYSITHETGCMICENQDIAHYIAPFMTSGVPYDKVIQLIMLKFGIKVTEDVLAKHKNHIICTYIPDGELEKRIMSDMRIIETDNTSTMDTNVVIESTIRGLNARRLFLEKTNTYGKEWTDIIQQLKQWTELKLKKLGDLPSDDDVSAKDLIKIISDNNENTTNKEDRVRAD